MKNLLKWPLLALLALTATAFQACDDDLEGIKPEEWDKTVSQTVEGVKFSLTPYAADEAEDGTLTFSGPCNDFPVGSYVWFLLEVENNTEKAIYLKSFNDKIQIYSQYGAPVTLLTTSPISQPAEEGIALQPGEKSSGIHMGILQHCWPADLLSKAVDCRPWTTRENWQRKVSSEHCSPSRLQCMKPLPTEIFPKPATDCSMPISIWR